MRTYPHHEHVAQLQQGNGARVVESAKKCFDRRGGCGQRVGTATCCQRVFTKCGTPLLPEANVSLRVRQRAVVDESAAYS